MKKLFEKLKRTLCPYSEIHKEIELLKEEVEMAYRLAARNTEIEDTTARILERLTDKVAILEKQSKIKPKKRITK